MTFDAAKVAHMAAYFLIKKGGKMPYLKIMKLLYLADREKLLRKGFPMSEDTLVSMDHGPVLSNTLDLIKGDLIKGVKSEETWNSLISEKQDYHIALKKNIEVEDLNELSPSDLKILECVWNNFGRMNQWDLVHYTHKECSEWKDPEGSSSPIPFIDIFRAFGMSEEQAKIANQRIEEQKQIDDFLEDLQ